MPKLTKKEKVICVRVVKCYLDDPKGSDHRIALTNTGRVVMLDHHWETAKLLRSMTKPTLCCLDFVIGQNVHGTRVERSYIHARMRADNQARVPEDKYPSGPRSYQRRLYSQMLGQMNDTLSLYNRGPYQHNVNINPTYVKVGMVGAPRWVYQPRGRTHAGQVDIPYSVQTYIDILRNPDTLGHKYPMMKVPHRDTYTHVQTATNFNGEQAYWLPYLMELRAGDMRIAKGLLIDPNQTNLPSRIRFARGMVTSEGVTILSVEDMTVG